MRTQRFNLVEIVIALGIVAIGVTAVMGFLPVGLNASRDAIADNYAADSSEQLLHYLASNIQEDWSRLDEFNSVPPNVATGSGDLSTWTVIPDTNIYTKDYGGKPVYRILQQTDDIAGVGTTVVDFDAMTIDNGGGVVAIGGTGAISAKVALEIVENPGQPPYIFFEIGDF